MDTVLFWFAIILFVILLFYIITWKTKEERENEANLKRSLEDEYLVDPDTGTKITLEQAETGRWTEHNGRFKTPSDSEINNNYGKHETKAQEGFNYLINNRIYTKTVFKSYELNIISNTNILSKYDDWYYSNVFKFIGGFLFLPAPKLDLRLEYEEAYDESQLMFWVKITDIRGHYFLREKSSSEKLFDLIRNDDELHLTNYECFTIKPSSSVSRINRLLEIFEGHNGLEIELHNDNLFVKTLKQFNKKDIIRIQDILSKVDRNY